MKEAEPGDFGVDYRVQVLGIYEPGKWGNLAMTTQFYHHATARADETCARGKTARVVIEQTGEELYKVAPVRTAA